jgi:uncharacterized membrane protein
MLVAVSTFQKHKFVESALWTAIAISFKFFPVVILLPAALILYKAKKLKELVKYFTSTIMCFILINLPFALVDFRGWSYFYEFSFKREIGSGSIFEALNRVGTSINFGNSELYILNIGLLLVTCFVLYKFDKTMGLPEQTFCVLFAFTLLNKQYSMQYVMWLSPFALIAISRFRKRFQRNLLQLYGLWQGLELLFHIFFFNHVLTYTGRNQGVTLTNLQVSDFAYGIVAITRYSVFIIFYLYLTKSQLQKSKILSQ